MQTKKVLIVHGWGSNSREHWFLEEKARLEKKGFVIGLPDMPNTENPKKDEWVEVIERFCPDENSILIGHSLGGVAILRYLEKAKQKVGKSILIATPAKKLGKKRFEVFANFFEPDFDWQTIKANCGKFIVLNQTNDVYVPLRHGKDLAKRLDAQLVVVEGKDHFDTIDFGLLEKFIL